MKSLLIKLVLIGFFSLWITSCSKISKPGQAIQTDFVTLSGGTSQGQTFIAHFDGMAGIKVYLKPNSEGNGVVTLHLRSSPESDEDIRNSSISFEKIKSERYYKFDFSPIDHSSQQDYYFYLGLQGNGAVDVGATYDNTFLNGSHYDNHLANEGQLTFNLVYHPKELLKGLIEEVVNWMVWVLAAIFLFVIPGWSLLTIANPTNICTLNKALLGIGLSLSVYPVTMLWTRLVGVHLGGLYAWLPPIISLILLVLAVRKKGFQNTQKIRLSWHDLAFIFVVALIIAVRFWSVRTFDAPLWGDSVQHTVMTQLLVDNHGLFNSWAPYAELQTFTYHFGFHSLAAVFHWITGLPIIKSVLIVGQIINILAILALYPLTTRLTNNPWAGIVTILMAGLLLPMPMGYTNWGRYTQLAGLAILPVIVYLSWEILEHKSKPKVLYPLTWLALGGLALTHYRVLIFAIIFYISYLLVYLGNGYLKLTLSKIFWIGLGGLIVSMPWFIHTIAGKLDLLLLTQLSTPASSLSESASQANQFGNLLVYLPLLAWILLPAVIGWGLWRRDRSVLLLSSWWYLILLAANPQWLLLPGAGVITTFAVMISLYLPASIIFGLATHWIMEAGEEIGSRSDLIMSNAKNWVSTLASILMVALILSTGIWGAYRRKDQIDIYTHALLARPDLRAFDWINENLPPDAGFLVNSIFAYNDSSIVGSDGGWWLPILTARNSTQPPLPYTSEKGPRPDYISWINLIPKEILSKGLNHPDILKELQARGITHIYVGQRQGAVNSAKPLIQLETILADPHFTPVYHQDRVWIFQIIP